MGLKESPTGLEKSHARLNESFLKAKDTSLSGLKQSDLLSEERILETETLIDETSLNAVVETFSKSVI